MKNFFCLFFYSRIFACKKISLKKVFILLGWWIYFSWLKLLFIYRLPHFLSVKWRFPIKNIFQNQKIWKAEQKRIARFESWKRVCYIPLIWKMPFNDRDSIKIRDIKDYHIFFECEMKISFINTITGLKNMEDSRDRRFQKRDILTIKHL